MLALSLLVLIALIVDLVNRSWSVWTDRPGDFLTTNLNSQSAEQAGIGQAIRGTVILCVIVVAGGVPARHRLRRLPRGVRADARSSPGSPGSTSATSPVCRRSSTGCSASRSSSSAVGHDRRSQRVRRRPGDLGALVLPIVVITTSEALRAVPRQHPGGGFGVGATRWEDGAQPRPAVRPHRHPHRHGAVAWPGRSARRHRCCSSEPRRGSCARATRACGISCRDRSRRCPIVDLLATPASRVTTSAR